MFGPTTIASLLMPGRFSTLKDLIIFSEGVIILIIFSSTDFRIREFLKATLTPKLFLKTLLDNLLFIRPRFSQLKLSRLSI